jgi:hypothetical protein
MRAGSWLVSLEFEAREAQATAVLRLPDGRPVWAYRCPPAVAHSANPPARRARPE